MAKIRTIYLCSACGARAPKWLGRCPECEAWNTLVEQQERSVPPSAQGHPAGRLTALPASQIEREELQRLLVPIAEFSRVLGGGIVPGSLVLIGGDPGVGKSTLMMQVSEAVARAGKRVLYVSGEESLPQVGLRARRLGLEAPELLYAAENQLDVVLDAVERLQPALVVIDSIQSVYDRALESSPGSVTQLRECTLRCMQSAKASETAIFLVGHVTKEGAIAGPKVVEHMVDAVLYLEGERFQAYRLLRSTKNRFGATHEVGVFEMRGEGMAEVANPSLVFLSDRGEPSPGSIVTATLEGTRPLLVEVQALAGQTSFAQPRRVSNGFDFNRLLLLTAVLSRRLSVPLYNQDIYVNVVGGLRIEEPAADLAVALAVLSSIRDRALDPGLIAVGEVGLSGELRPVGQLDKRLREAAKLGFERAIVPKSAAVPSSAAAGLQVHSAASLREAAALARL
jgi:DNA repair protein RadA/Sms